MAKPTLKYLLVAVLGLALLSVAGMRGVFLWMEYHRTLAQAQATTADLTRVVTEYAVRSLENALLLTDLVTAQVAAANPTPADLAGRRGDDGLHAYLRRLTERTSAHEYLMVVDAQGRPVALTTGRPPPDLSLADRPWFRAHADGGHDFWVGEALHSRINGEVLFTFSRRIQSESGVFLGVVQMARRPVFLDELAAASRYPGQITLSIHTTAGALVARTGLTPERLGQPDPLGNWVAAMAPPAAAGQPVQAAIVRQPADAAGPDRIVAAARLADWPLVISVSLPMAAVLSTWSATLYWSLALVAAVGLAMGALIWLALRLSARESVSRTRLESALADKEVLFREVHHRVKNNLQISSALLQLQARRFKDSQVRAAFDETSDRLNAIGLVHEILYRDGQAAAVDLSRYLDSLAQQLSLAYGAASRGIDITLDVPPCRMDLERAVPVALLLSEVITNAFKHAFPPGHTGCIAITGRRDGQELVLRVADTGVGLAPGREVAADHGPDGLPARGVEDSVGMTLIAALSRQAGGRFTLDSAPTGTTFLFTVPVGLPGWINAPTGSAPAAPAPPSAP